MMRTRTNRGGVTLIELLVVMAIITALGLLALMLLPGINNSDAALKATEEVRAQCKIAQALAGAARQPRGVRFLVQTGATTGTAAAPLGSRYATEIQLLESPPVTVPDPFVLSFAPAGVTAGVSDQTRLNNAPRVDILYDLYDGNTANPNQPSGPKPQAGTVMLRHCRAFNLTQPQQDQIAPGAILVLPALGFWARINSTPTPVGAGGVEISLDVYPDVYMGASTAYRTYHFGIYGPPVPLLGQPTIPLPKNVGVDLDLCSPPIVDPSSPAPATLPNYDIMFAPDGQLISVRGQPSNAGVYLWVRDVTKTVNPSPVGGGASTSMVKAHYSTLALWADAFRRGGEQHAVGVSNGFVGTAPIQWPDASGNYANGNEFTFVRKRMQ